MANDFQRSSQELMNLHSQANSDGPPRELMSPGSADPIDRNVEYDDEWIGDEYGAEAEAQGGDNQDGSLGDLYEDDAYDQEPNVADGNYDRSKMSTCKFAGVDQELISLREEDLEESKIGDRSQRQSITSVGQIPAGDTSSNVESLENAAEVHLDPKNLFLMSSPNPARKNINGKSRRSNILDGSDMKEKMVTSDTKQRMS